MFIKYGKNAVHLPSSPFSFKIIKKTIKKDKPLVLREIADRIDHPIASPPIPHLIGSGDSVLIVVSDATRATGVSVYLPLLIDRLLGAGVKNEDISLIFATGVHRRVTDDEKKSILGDGIFSRFGMIDHDPHRDSDLKPLGKTAHGTEAKANATLFHFSKIVLTGAVQFHYHAGFTGGRKSLIPGLASYQTAARNHLLSINDKGVKDPRSKAGRLKGNPVHEDILEAALNIPRPFIINTIIDEQGKIDAIFSGDMIKAHEKAVQHLSERRIIHVGKQAELVLAGCGGYPKDINFIQAHKCIENCSHLVRDGGVLIAVAECQDGFGSVDFLKWFSMGREKMLSRLKKDFMAYGQTALSILKILERIHIVMVSKLDPIEISKIGMNPASSLKEALQKAESLIDSKSPGCVIEDGTKHLFRIG